MAACLCFIAAVVFAFRNEQRLPNTPIQRVVVSQAHGTGLGIEFACDPVQVLDGDTLRCGGQRVRLASIDAPEMPGHCRRGRTCVPGDPIASAEHLRATIEGKAVACRQIDVDVYSRRVAFCAAGDVDLSCEQVQHGFAVVRYGTLSCPRRGAPGNRGASRRRSTRGRPHGLG